MWLGERRRWAHALVASWQQTQVTGKLHEAMREEGLPLAGDEMPAAVMMGRIREHLEVDAQALRAAEEAYARLSALKMEEQAAQEAISGLPPGEGRDRLGAAAEQLSAEANNIEGTLAALYATLLTRDASPTFGGLKDTMLELEAEVEVAQTLAGGEERSRQLGARAGAKRHT